MSQYLFDCVIINVFTEHTCFSQISASLRSGYQKQLTSPPLNQKGVCFPMKMTHPLTCMLSSTFPTGHHKHVLTRTNTHLKGHTPHPPTPPHTPVPVHLEDCQPPSAPLIQYPFSHHSNGLMYATVDVTNGQGEIRGHTVPQKLVSGLLIEVIWIRLIIMSFYFLK